MTVGVGTEDGVSIRLRGCGEGGGGGGGGGRAGGMSDCVGVGTVDSPEVGKADPLLPHPALDGGGRGRIDRGHR